MKNFNPWKLLIAVFAGAYFAAAWFTPEKWRFLDYVNLILHEAGHPLMMLFGETASFWGGTIFQLLIPAVFAGYFYWHRQRYSAGLVMFWLAESFGNVSIYASDALKMQLPLLGGDNSVHDWNWLLLKYGMLRHAIGVGQFIHILGLLALVLGIYLSLKYSLKSDTEKSWQ